MLFSSVARNQSKDTRPSLHAKHCIIADGNYIWLPAVLFSNVQWLYKLDVRTIPVYTSSYQILNKPYMRTFPHWLWRHSTAPHSHFTYKHWHSGRTYSLTPFVYRWVPSKFLPWQPGLPASILNAKILILKNRAQLLQLAQMSQMVHERKLFYSIFPTDFKHLLCLL